MAKRNSERKSSNSDAEPGAKSRAGTEPKPAASKVKRSLNHSREGNVKTLCLLLSILTLATFLPAVGNDFVRYDDGLYVTENQHVRQGLTMESVKWAFHSDVVTGNWHPLTWLSHMLDCQFFGLKPWGHHLTSIAFHTLNAVLVFLLFKRMTRAAWRSLCVAALFGVHPMRVESVAWVAE